MYKFSMFVYYFGITIFMSQGISLIFRQKTFDFIAYLFYDKRYLDVSTIDLTLTPYWVSLLLGLLFILFPIWIFFKDR